MLRLDKFLCDINQGTRSVVKELIRNGLVTVNGSIVQRPEYKISETDHVTVSGKQVRYQKYSYYMLNKPVGVVTATKDLHDKTVMDLLEGITAKNISPVGRLDKDTEGLLILTNDGERSHRLLSPRHHVSKVYEIVPEHSLSEENIRALENGVDIGDDKKTLPSHVMIQPDGKVLLAIREGRFHQVKRMLEAVENKVLHLKRLRMAGVSLDPELAPGSFRELTQEEICSLEDKTPDLSGIDAVIFDVDGSLVDSMGLWKQIDIDYLAKFGIEMPENFQSDLDGMSFYQTAAYFKQRFSIADSLEQMMDDWNRMAWDKYLYEVPLKSGVTEFLELCFRRGIKMGIATSNSRELMQNLEQAHGLTRYISIIKTGSEVQNGKPAPDIYLEASRELEVDPARCLVFEDIVAGIQAGKAAGMKVCAVRDEYSRDQDLKKHELADFYIEDYYQITDRNMEKDSTEE